MYIMFPETRVHRYYSIEKRVSIEFNFVRLCATKY